MTWLGHCGLDYNTSDISLILSILLSVIETNMGISYTYISVMKTWAGAQAYCRQNHTDIVMIEDEALNTQIDLQHETSNKHLAGPLPCGVDVGRHLTRQFQQLAKWKTLQ